MKDAVCELAVQPRTVKLPINRAIIHVFSLKAWVELEENAPLVEGREKYKNF